MSPEAQLAGFLAKFTPEIEALATGALARMRERLPGAVELAYDNYNALAVGFGPSERTSDAIFSIAVFPRTVSLFLFQNADWPDPAGVLRGSGKASRHIPLASPETIDSAPVEALIALALRRARVPIDPTAPNRLVIRSISAKQRPRRH